MTFIPPHKHIYIEISIVSVFFCQLYIYILYSIHSTQYTYIVCEYACTHITQHMHEYMLVSKHLNIYRIFIVKGTVRQKFYNSSPSVLVWSDF